MPKETIAPELSPALVTRLAKLLTQAEVAGLIPQTKGERSPSVAAVALLSILHRAESDPAAREFLNRQRVWPSLTSAPGVAPPKPAPSTPQRVSASISTPSGPILDPTYNAEPWPDPVAQALAFLASVPDAPPSNGAGVVTAAGNPTHRLMAWVLLRLLQSLGCKLPGEVWYAGRYEYDARFDAWLTREGWHYRDAVKRGFVGHPIRRETVFHVNNMRYPEAWQHGYALKPFAIAHSAYREVLWLDADCHPLRDPAMLLNSRSYQRTGCLLWPDTGGVPNLPAFGISRGCVDAAPFGCEAGQMAIDKARAWPAVALANWYGATGDYWMRSSWGDKDFFYAAWLVAGYPFAIMPPAKLIPRDAGLIHHDEDGKALFFHRAGPTKWGRGVIDLDGFPLNEIAQEAAREWNAG